MITSSSASCAGEMESDVEGMTPAENAENFLTTTITKKGRFEMTDLTKFFEALSERAYKENDLSDVTYALCESDSCFRQFFIDFFFGKHRKIDASKVVITREVSTEWGRPDFYIRDNNGTLFIVEVKIWDGSHHFEQYYDILAGNQAEGQKTRGEGDVWHSLGYIANYDAVKGVTVETNKQAAEVCARVATWKEFVEELELYSCFNDSAIQAYVKYVKNVCPFDDFKLEEWIDREITKLSENFKAVGLYADAINGCIDSAKEGLKRYDFKQYNSKRKDDLRYMMPGRKWFEFNLGENTESKKVWGSVYVRYKGNDGGAVCVEFENINGWGKPIFDKFSIKNGSIRFYMFMPDDSAGISKKDIGDFIKKVVLDVQGDSIKDLLRNDTNYVVSNLLSMKALPMMLEQKIYEGLNSVTIGGKNYEFRFADGDDAEVSDSHCGRYFELVEKTEEQKQTQPVRGWLGMMYSSTHTGKSGSYREKPRFIIEIDKNFADVHEIDRDSWYNDSWGWKCYDCEFYSCEGILGSIEKGFKSLGQIRQK